ncbi:recombinase family protein [Lentzea sp. NPDC034063]|uniref:recombinase family protein n=1 Tax=unclassified Lentzea TaxID=2643253 RepID=UPI0033E466E6
MASTARRPKGTDDLFPPALRADRDYLLNLDESARPCVFYFRKSVGDDFATQVMRCLQYARSANLRLDPTLGVGGVFFDEDKSGMKNVERLGYDRLMSGVMRGDLKDHFVIVRDQDRLSRKESSVLEEYHIITELAKVRTFESTGREIKDDIATGVIGVVNRAEAKITAARQRAKKEFRAISGMPPAGRIRKTGYSADYTAINWEEAKILRRARNKAVSGQSLHSICEDMLRRGDVKRSGKPYIVSDISRLLRDPTYAGYRVFKRDIEVEGIVIPKGTPVSKGSWPKIFTEDEHHEVVKHLSKNKAWATENKAKYLLSGILVCAECGTTMAHQPKIGKKHKDGSANILHVYSCHKKRGGCGKLSRNARALDKFFIELTYQAILRLPDATEQVVDNTGNEITRLEAKISTAIQAFKDDIINIAELADIKQDAQEKISALKKDQVKRRQPLPVDDAESFMQAEVAKKRDTIRRFFPRVGVKRVGSGVRFKPDQLVFPEHEED